MDSFGSTDAKLMPRHLFPGALALDYESAVKSDPSKQNYSVCPRHWYIDAQFLCNMCYTKFIWSSTEQKTWFEDWDFWTDSCPYHCPDCRKKRRTAKAAKQEYDAIVQSARTEKDLALKTRVIALIDEMGGPSNKLPDKMIETYLLFQRQLKDSVN